MTPEQIAGVRDPRSNPGIYDPRQLLAMEWAEKVTRNSARADDALFERLRGEFSEQEIVELTMAAAMWNMTNRLNESFATDLETPAPGAVPLVHVAHQALAAYAATTAPPPTL